MDWIESHWAIVDCYEMTSPLKNDQGEPTINKGIKHDVTLHLISLRRLISVWGNDAIFIH